MMQKFLVFVGLILLVVIVMAGLAAGQNGGVQAAQEITPTPLPDPVMGELDLDALRQIDLAAYPVVPEIDDHALQLYQDSLAQGNNPHTFAKVGDCMTQNPYFLIPMGEGHYDLGTYTDLQRVVDQFVDGDLNSFARISQAAAGGFNSASVLDSLWANPEFCEANETPLACEYRTMQPSIALIMFGTNDVQYLDEKQFDFFLRSVVVATIRNHTLPILSTFPQRPEFPDKALLYNQIVVQVALDYDVPLINLWQALEPLPNQGVDPVDTTHLATPADGLVCTFTEDHLDAGFNMRNLVTLQTLGAVLDAAGEE
jgi:hypothetical protein